MSRLVATALDPAALVASVQSVARGGVVTFLGVVRNHHAGKAVVDLDYSAYPPMADRVLAEILAETMARWPVSAAIEHRVGPLVVGDLAVAVVVAGDHRDEAFEACRYLIEQVKVRVPIWKRERYRDGSEAWVDPTATGAGHPVAGSEVAP